MFGQSEEAAKEKFHLLSLIHTQMHYLVIIHLLQNEGYNELPSSKPKSVLSIAFGVVKESKFLLLVACGTLSLILGDIQEGLMLLSFVFVIMGIEFFQEKKTEKALDALKYLASPRALIIRDGETIRIPLFVYSGSMIVQGN